MRIAIVGLACIYPDAKNPVQLWENVLAKRRAFRRLPPERLNLDDYFAPDPAVPDAIYAQEAAVLEGYAFDRVRFRISGSTFRSVDLSHWLALEVAGQALADAGFPEGEGLPKDTAGVLVGNTLTGEFSRAQVLRLRWPYVRRVVEERLVAEGWSVPQRQRFLKALEERYKAAFEPVGEETLAGSLSNTIAGRICNHFGLHGGGYTVDGACSSSLLAVAQACLALESGELDAALVGGVDLSLDPFELVGFAKAGALAKDKMRVYDRASNGFLPGEGCGFAVLLREQDARALGLRIYASICGLGISSDGGGGITRPESLGQRLALERAYRRAGYPITSVSLIEGHGTGTQVGDEVELATLSQMLARAKWKIALGSIKANIGHTKAAAGIAGLIKATLAVYQQILPPATGVETPHALLTQGPLYAPEQARPWPENRPRRAGVSAFGFGGINVHVTLEGEGHPQNCNPHRLAPFHLASAQDAELFVLEARDPSDLSAQVQRLRGLVARLSYAELTDLAACLAQGIAGKPWRAALVAATPTELEERLASLQAWLDAGTRERLDAQAGVFLSARATSPRIAFLFPGQASPVRFSGGIWQERFAEIRSLYPKTNDSCPAEPISTALAQPAIALAELAGIKVLKSFKLEADLVIGHSLGELIALHWAGAMGEESLLELVQARAQAMAAAPGSGAMASLAAPAEQVQTLLAGQTAVVIAGYNSPQQTVISGPTQAVTQIVAKAQTLKIAAIRLAVSHAFHSPLMAPAAERLTPHLNRKRFYPVSRRVLSTVTGTWLKPEEDLRALLRRQLTSPVRFRQALTLALPEADLWLEVGPGQVLSGLVRATASVPMIALDCAGNSLRGLLCALGAAYALGARIELKRLFADRFYRPFDPDRELRFLSNPCERAPRFANQAVAAENHAAAPVLENPVEPQTAALPLLRELVAQRAELPATAIQDHHHLLRDLHLNSITISQIIAEAAKRLGLAPPLAPTEYAGATLAQAAQALEESRTRAVGRLSEAVPLGVDAWVHALAGEYLTRPLPKPAKRKLSPPNWQVFAPAGHPLAPLLAKRLQALGGQGVLVCLSPEAEDFGLLLAAAHAALKLEQGRFVLVQHRGIAASFARSLYLEAQTLTVCVVDVPPTPAAGDWVVAETQAAEGYREVYYDAQGQRWEPALRLLALAEDGPLPLGPQDVLLISGGGKGIAAECGLALAQESGAKLLLLGRSRPEKDPALAANLKRFAALGVVFRYHAADVTDAAAVRRALVAGTAELGPVTAILHGAGVNRPCPVRRLDQAALTEAIAPKLAGLAHLLAAVDEQRLRLLIAFSSIIGRIGFHGEAHYALANAALSRRLEDFHRDHPHCRCLAVEWSIWSGVGMGERLGRVDALLGQGISPISPEAGISWLRRLLKATTPVRVVVSGRLGSKPALPIVPETGLPFLRFLENPRLFYPGIELVAEAELSPTQDPYLDDHVLQGERLLPAVMGLEAMAQAAQAVTGETKVPSFEEVKFLRPIAVGEEGITLRIAALVRHPGTVEVALRSSQTAFQCDHFRALCRFDLAPLEERAPPDRRPCKLALDPDRDLYGRLLFQRGRFKRLAGYYQLAAFGCQAELTQAESAWFSPYLPQELRLGDPGSRDAAVHAVQACIPDALLLPVGLTRWRPGDLRAPGPWIVRAQERAQEGEVFCYDLEVYGANGVLRERFEGLQLRRMQASAQTHWPRGLLVPHVQRQVRDRIGASVHLMTLGEDSPSLRQVFRRPDGKPVTLSAEAISVAHCGGWTLTVTSANPVACDLERIAPRPWRELLGERYALAELIARQLEEDFDSAATRVWTAQECLKKLGLAWDTPILCKAAAERWAVLSAGAGAIASWCGEVEGAKMALSILSLKAF
ncbi:type I polyketide synthase [Methylothermus subterraneus]